MKKALVRRVVSLFLCFCMVIGFVPIIDAQAAEIKGGTFDPHTGYLELEFGYQLTQYVNINVYPQSFGRWIEERICRFDCRELPALRCKRC